MSDTIILGTGPAALTAATFLTRAGIRPVLFERRPSPGWKLLVAGSSGLNVTYDGPEEELASHYSARRNEIGHCLQRFPRSAWLQLLTELGEEPYVGSSRRYFLRSRTAASLLKSWTARLEEAGATFHYGEELAGIVPGGAGTPLTLRFASGREETAQAALLALGGGSWEEEPPKWPAMLKSLGLEGSRLEPSNAGFSFSAPPGFFEKAEGKPVKGLVLTTARGARQGELMITKYGLEGTPVYTVGCPGPATLDLKPDLTEEKLAQRLAAGKGAMMSRLEHAAKLSPGALLLLKALAYPHDFETPTTAARAIKALPIELLEPRPLSESISARGGLSWNELSKDLEVKKIPGLFAAGEMVDWDAPTGGFLIQASVSMGFVAAEGIQAFLGRSS
jgi:uncharacterized flavoprotein (TIGR03862 family)